LKEELKLRVFENREWRKLHNEELNDLYSSPNIVRVIKSGRMGGTCSTHGERRGVYGVLMWEPEGKETTWKTQA